MKLENFTLYTTPFEYSISNPFIPFDFFLIFTQKDFQLAPHIKIL